MNVQLLAHTPDPEKVIAAAAKLCYAKSDIQGLFDKLTPENTEKFLEHLASLGHESPIEHVTFTFGIEGVSRSLLAQITRHRIASFSVQSQRYVALGGDDVGFDYIVPPAIAALGEEAAEEYRRQMETMDKWYQEWRVKLGGGKASNEDARFVLPNAAATRIVMTMNARELIHFLSLRCCNRAQWEIRAVAWTMLELAYEAAPSLFKKTGPGCLNGACPEGKMTCGKAAEIRARHDKMTGK